MTTSTELPREAYTLLAQANLLRMRGKWQEAIEMCMAAMHLAPDSATAQSLLGDIYENQGCIDDAIQWYQMALDINPESAADTLKLARLRDSNRRVLPGDTAAASASEVKEPLSLSEADTFVIGRARGAGADRLLRGGAIFAGLSMLLIFLVALLAHGRLGAGAPRSIATAPVYIVPQKSFADTDDSPPRDPFEQTLVTDLRAAPELAGADVIVADAQFDPRASRLTLTLLIGATPLSRDSVARSAVRVLQAAARLPEAEGINAFTIRCLSAPPAGTSPGGVPLLMTADTARAALPADLSPSAAAAWQSLLTNLWWASSLPT